MLVKDLRLHQVKPGLRVQGLKGRLGTVVFVEVYDDALTWILWDDDTAITSAWYGTNVELTVVVTDQGVPVYVEVEISLKFIDGMYRFGGRVYVLSVMDKVFPEKIRVPG